MKIVLALLVLLGCLHASAADRSRTVTATGTMYFELDMVAEESPDADGVNFAFFVPDASSLSKFPAVTSGEYAAPVRHISFEPADQALVAAVGASSAQRILHGGQPIIAMPVTVTLRNFRSKIECDSRNYYATLISVK